MDESFMFGRLTFDDIAIFAVFRDFSVNELVASGAGWLEVLAAVGVVALLTYFRLWGVLWRDWLTTQDHKKIGIMYMVIGFVMMRARRGRGRRHARRISPPRSTAGSSRPSTSPSSSRRMARS